MSKYINANALIIIIDAQMSNIKRLKQIQDKKILEWNKCQCAVHFDTKLETFNNVLKTIDEIQEADVVPVIHAKWLLRRTLKNKTDFVCSHCSLVMNTEFPYCPDCGARMDMDEEENAENE